MEDITALLKTTGSVTDSIGKLIAENSLLKKNLEKLQSQAASSAVKELISKAVIVNKLTFVSGIIEGASPDTLKNAAWQARNSIRDMVLILGSESDGKANLLVLVTDELVKERNISAAAIVKAVSQEIKGGGGGQPFLATAGGKNPEGLESAFRKAEEYLRTI